MTRALWITAQAPGGRSGGGAVRQAALLHGLATAADTDVVLAGAWPDDDLRPLLGHVTEVAVRPTPVPRHPVARRARHLLDSVVFRRPPELMAHRPVLRALRPLLADGDRYDVVCVDSVGLAPLIPAQHRNRWVLNLHNRPSGMAAHRRTLVGGRRAWLLRREEVHARRFELWAAQAYDLVVTVSEEDAAGLAGPVAVVPNGVDTSGVVPTVLPAAPRLVFTGALYTLPNVDGAEWFVREVLPLVRRAVAGTVVDIVGFAPTLAVTALAGVDGVEVHADVTSVVPYLEAARVAVVPLRIGTGTRLKALEAMAAGRPVAGTSIGLEGLGVEHGRTAWVADTAEDLAAGIVQLLTDDDLARGMADAGRRLVEQKYDWSAIGQAYVEAVVPRAATRR